jgi:hypothetical protein
VGQQRILGPVWHNAGRVTRLREGVTSWSRHFSANISTASSYDGEDLRDVRTFFELELMQGERQREFRILRQDQDVRLTVPPGRLTGLTLVARVPPTLMKPGL